LERDLNAEGKPDPIEPRGHAMKGPNYEEARRNRRLGA